MRRWTGILITTVLLIAMAFTLVVVAARLFLPKKIRAEAVRVLENETGGKAHIGAVTLDIFKGIVFNDIRLSKNGHALFSAQQASAGFNILSLISGRLIIDSLKLDSPCILIERRANGSFDNPQLFRRPLTSAHGAPVVLREIRVRSGRVDFIDRTSSPPITGNLAKIELSVRLFLPASAAIDGNYEFSLASRPLTVRGPLEFTPAGVSWRGLRIEYAGQNYTSSGRIKDFRSPLIELGIYSPEMCLEATAETKNKLLAISRLKADFRTSSLFLQGTVDLSQPAAVPVKLSLSADLELADLGLFLNDMGFWKNSAPAGKITAEITARGGLKQASALDIAGTVKSKKLRAYGIQAGNLTVDYEQSGGTGTAIFNFSLYDGTVNGRASLEPALAGIPFSGQISAEGVLLEKLKAATPLADRDISGSIATNAVFSGKFNPLARTEGNGTIAVTKGKLMQLDILRGLSQTLFPELISMTFEKGSGNFHIDSNGIVLSKYTLTSSLLQLTGNGSLCFDGAVNALMDIQVSEQILPNLGKLKELAADILRQTGKIVAVRVTGTRQKPRYALRQPLISDVTRGLKGMFGKKKLQPAKDRAPKK